MWKLGWRRKAAGSVLLLWAALAPGWAETPPAPGETAPAEPEAAGGAPRIEFATLQHDFGDVDSGPDLETTFAFKNAGDGVLVIEKVKGG